MPVGMIAIGDVTPRRRINRAVLSLGAITPSHKLAKWVGTSLAISVSASEASGM
ncbi:hypothetical protein D3C83_320650 [compost metagenome]